MGCMRRGLLRGASRGERRPAWLPLGTTANKMGRVAGANAAGRGSGLRDRGTSIVRIGGLAGGDDGALGGAGPAGWIHARGSCGGGSGPASLFLGRMVSVCLVGTRIRGDCWGRRWWGRRVLGRVNVVATALAARMRVEDFAEVDMAYAPPYATALDPLMVAARQLAELVD